ncbi:amidohydrolase [Neorhizobium alkalisoli]|uniref:Amidohydrolase n=1 Tax=Neorhizobium alkalisoli TaxID=528178 RepID=A0A561QVE4_9HYPH|nr:amidohydrolase [Neorhizobium alkalisoli]TWF54340.1 amidohydrolase [Neorhizobium alkalisoli]
MYLTNQDIVELTAWRRKLHTMPEVSGEEVETAREVVRFLKDTAPDAIIEGLGGTGVAAIYDSGITGPTVLIRAELDALPIEEIGEPDHRSKIAGKGHMCGHDGHMATLAAVGRRLGRERPKRGRVILLFQPAEETGAGAAAVIADEKFKALTPDYSLSLHNMPGIRLGHAWLKDGQSNCASRGIRIVLTGRTAHASTPETGISPVNAVSKLMPALTALGTGPQSGSIETGDLVRVTVTHATIGEPAFGIAPAHGEVWATLRTSTDDQMAALVEAAENLAREAAAESGLTVEIDYHDVFGHCINDPEAAAILRAAMDAEGVTHEAGQAFRGSEDFGRFGAVSKSAMLFLGSGETLTALHSPNYDFPDDLIPIGAKIFLRATQDILG